MTKDTRPARAIELPVASPNGDWKEFRECLKTCWEQSTSLANWCVMELAKADVVRLPGQDKMPKLDRAAMNAAWGQEKGGLYQRAVRCYPFWGQWKGSTGSASSIVRAVERKWSKIRWAASWANQEDKPGYKYPAPFPIRSQDFCIWQDDGGTMMFSANIGGKRWELRLRGGPGFRRQMAIFREMLAGKAGIGEAAIYRKRKPGNRNRGGIQGRENGRTTDYDVFVKLVYRREREEPKEGHTLLVRTDPNAFWVVELEGRDPWIVNADHVRRIVSAHSIYRQRMSEDLKHEKRWPKKMRQQMLAALDLRCSKAKNRIETWADQAVAMLAGFARRNGIGTVIYDDADTSYCQFPWFSLRKKLEDKMKQAGAVLVSAKGVAPGGDDECEER